MRSHKEFICNICHLGSINGCRRPAAHYSYKSLPSDIFQLRVSNIRTPKTIQKSTGNDDIWWHDHNHNYCGFSGPLNVDTGFLKSPKVSGWTCMKSSSVFCSLRLSDGWEPWSPPIPKKKLPVGSLDFMIYKASILGFHDSCLLFVWGGGTILVSMPRLKKKRPLFL